MGLFPTVETQAPAPGADPVLCRDCFIHLPTRLIRAALRNFRATGARYLLLTNDRNARGAMPASGTQSDGIHRSANAAGCTTGC